MSEANQSQGGSGLKGIRRINTGLSEASAHQPRSSASGSGRLSLHIPNAYPRALSPRSPNSRDATPKSSRPGSPSESAPQQQQQQSSTSTSSVFGNLKDGHIPSVSTREDNVRIVAHSRSSSRSSVQAPKIRVYRRDSSLITAQHVDHVNTPIASSDPVLQEAQVHLSPTSLSARLFGPLRDIQHFFATDETSSGSARDFLARERNFFSWLRLSCLLAILSASLILQLQLPNTARTSSRSPHASPRRRSDTNPVDWDDLPLSSKAFAATFFIMSLLSLGTGLADYLSAERHLEKEHVDFDETEGVFLNDGHTSHFVHAIVLVIGAGITAFALWLLAV